MLHSFWVGDYGSILCGLCGHQSVVKLPYKHMPNKTYCGCFRCETNIEHCIYGESANLNKSRMRNRRIVFEIIFWSFWIAVFLFFGYLSVSWL